MQSSYKSSNCGTKLSTKTKAERHGNPHPSALYHPRSISSTGSLAPQAHCKLLLVDPPSLGMEGPVVVTPDMNRVHLDVAQVLWLRNRT
jgi:hypothetical protein